MAEFRVIPIEVFPTEQYSNIETFAEKNLAGKVCLSPFVSATISIDGTVSLCGCSAWMPADIGNIKTHKLIDLINNKLSQKIKQSIINGTYTYCNELTCGIINNNQLNDVASLGAEVAKKITVTTDQLPTHITFAGDATCNLSCPSCRTDIVKFSEDSVEQIESVGKILVENVFSQPSDQAISLMLSTTGEVFASPILLKFVNSIDLKSFPNLTFDLQTNGLLCKARWSRIQTLESRIAKITVTVDASEKLTYEKLRRGGKWEDILENLEFLKTKKQQLGFNLHLRMVVQQDNYNQMFDFYNLSIGYDADLIEYARILKWNHMTRDQFIALDSFNTKNPEFELATQALAQVKHLPKTMFTNGL